jgi:hypothetical protein
VARTPRTSNPPSAHYSLWWWLFRSPGSAAIWLARRYQHPVIEVMYTLLIYIVLAPIVYFVWIAYTHEPPNRAEYHTQSTRAYPQGQAR